MCKLCKQPIGAACVSVEANKYKKEAKEEKNMQDEDEDGAPVPALYRLARSHLDGWGASSDPGPREVRLDQPSSGIILQHPGR